MTEPRPRFSLTAPYRAIRHRLSTLLRGQAGAGVLLLAVAVAALLIANSPFASGWEALLDGTLPPLPFARLLPLASARAWINEGLMAVFFFTIGLELKREILVGELAHAPTRRLPVLAAGAGMIAPALVFLALVLLVPGADAGSTRALAHGWAIPAATDIAFALGVLALLGKRVPASLRVFLLSVAVVDDLGAASIIALAYSGPIALVWLGAAGLVLAGLVALNLAGCRRITPYALLAVLLWGCVLRSGLSPTLAGVLAALAVPLSRGQQPDAGGKHERAPSPLLLMEAALAPWATYAIVPLFGLANAGVRIDGAGRTLAPLTLAVAGGLVLGKQLGIFGAVWLAQRTGFAPRPQGASWMQLWGVSLLGGIGFTMSLLLATLAFPIGAFSEAPGLVAQAKLGILGGSLVSALLGYAVLRWAGRSR